MLLISYLSSEIRFDFFVLFSLQVVIFVFGCLFQAHDTAREKLCRRSFNFSQTDEVTFADARGENPIGNGRSL